MLLVGFINTQGSFACSCEFSYVDPDSVYSALGDPAFACVAPMDATEPRCVGFVDSCVSHILAAADGSKVAWQGIHRVPVFVVNLHPVWDIAVVVVEHDDVEQNGSPIRPFVLSAGAVWVANPVVVPTVFGELRSRELVIGNKGVADDNALLVVPSSSYRQVKYGRGSDNLFGSHDSDLLTRGCVVVRADMVLAHCAGPLCF